MMTILDEVLRQCGFIGTLLVGGPDPDVPDRIMSMIFHTGKTAANQNFAEVYPDLKTTMTSSFNTFAHKCLSKSSFACRVKTYLTCIVVINKPTITAATSAAASISPSTAHGNAKSPVRGAEEGVSRDSEQAATNMDVNVMAGSSDGMDIVPVINKPTITAATSAAASISPSTAHGNAKSPVRGPEEGVSHDSEQAATDMDVDVTAGSSDGMDIVLSDVTNSAVEMDIDVEVDNGSNETFDDNSFAGMQTMPMLDEVPDEVPGQQATVQTIPVEARAETTVVQAPARTTPVRYLDGTRVSEYEWVRSETIKENRKVLAALGLDNMRESFFGKPQSTKGKENKGAGNTPSGKKVPWAAAGKRTLRSSGKAIPDT